MKPNLIRIRISLDYEVVGYNVDGEDIAKAAQDIFAANRDDIIREAIDFNACDLSYSKICGESDLPEGYDKFCLPWTKGNRDQSKDLFIQEILNRNVNK